MALDREPPFVETINDPEMLKHLDFMDDRAEIIISGIALDHMPFRTERFVEDDEYWSIVDQIKANGYDSSQPIHVRPARQGSWLVDVDDAPRFMAAKRVANDFFANLLTQKVSKVRFILHDTSMNGKYKAPRFSFGQGD
jgi:hypothetical protein